MTKELISIREVQSGCWMVTVDGRVIGDSKTYGTAGAARDAAIADVAADPQYRELAEIVRLGWDADVAF